jgi:hypothetical protein
VPFHFTVLSGGVEDFWGAAASASRSPTSLGVVRVAVPMDASIREFGLDWNFDVDLAASGSAEVTSWSWHLAWHTLELRWPFAPLTHDEWAKQVLTRAAALIPFREPDFYNLNFSYGWNRASLGAGFTLDRYGRVYGSDTPSLTSGSLRAGGGISATAGWLDGLTTPGPEAVRSFIEGSSFSVMAAYGVAVGRTRSGSVWATEFGASSPQVSLGRGSSVLLDAPRIPVGRR